MFHERVEEEPTPLLVAIDAARVVDGCEVPLEIELIVPAGKATDAFSDLCQIHRGQSMRSRTGSLARQPKQARLRRERGLGAVRRRCDDDLVESSTRAGAGSRLARSEADEESPRGCSRNRKGRHRSCVRGLFLL
jgi:hypothetical protein